MGSVKTTEEMFRSLGLFRNPDGVGWTPNPPAQRPVNRIQARVAAPAPISAKRNRRPSPVGWDVRQPEHVLYGYIEDNAPSTVVGGQEVGFDRLPQTFGGFASGSARSRH